MNENKRDQIKLEMLPPFTIQTMLQCCLIFPCHVAKRQLGI
jgi:hypothetical protein